MNTRMQSPPSSLAALTLLASLAVFGSACVTSHYDQDEYSPFVEGYAESNAVVTAYAYNLSTSLWDQIDSATPNPTFYSYKGDGLYKWVIGPLNVGAAYTDPSGFVSLQFRQNGTALTVYNRNTSDFEPSTMTPEQCVQSNGAVNYHSPGDWESDGSVIDIKNVNIFLDCGAGLNTVLHLEK